jgi:hypothetical protein
MDFWSLLHGAREASCSKKLEPSNWFQERDDESTPAGGGVRPKLGALEVDWRQTSLGLSFFGKDGVRVHHGHVRGQVHECVRHVGECVRVPFFRQCKLYAGASTLDQRLAFFADNFITNDLAGWMDSESSLGMRDFGDVS